jgi:hypothetical protein
MRFATEEEASAEIFIDAASEGASSVEKCCRAIQNLYRTMRISTELWQEFRLCWQLVAARRVGQGRTAGQSFVQAGWIEEIQNGADHPIPEGDPKNE